MLCRCSCRNNRNIFASAFILGKQFGEFLSQQMTVAREVNGFIDLNYFTGFVEQDYQILFTFTLKLQSIETAEFEKRAKVTTNITVNYNVGLR
ncbi:hypothetical protein DSECCO2_315110 [anaerobic digester metagenome]